MTRQRPGYMLIEMLVIMVVLAMVIGLSVLAILGIMRTYEADAALLQRVLVREQLAEAFRADVSAASAAPGRSGRFTASSRCLVLRRPGGSLVVYEPAGATVQRIDVHGDAETLQTFSLESDRIRIAFERGGPEDRLISLLWVERRGSEGAEIEDTLEFRAALGGDLQ